MIKRAAFLLAAWLLAAGVCHADQDPTLKPAFDLPLHTIVSLEDARDGARLLHWTRHGAPQVRARAARAMGRIQDVALLPELERLSHDEDALVRAEALFAMGQLWDAKAESPLLRLWGTAPTLQERLLIAEGLGKCAAPGGEGYHALLAATQDKSSLLRARACLSLGVLAYRVRRVDPNWSDDWQPLTSRLRDDSEDVRYSMAYAFYRMGWSAEPQKSAKPAWSGEVLPSLAALVRDGSARVRMAAAQAMGELSAKEALPTEIATLLADKDWRVRVAAVEAIGKAGGAPLLAQITPLLHDSSTLVIVTVLRALHQRDAVSALGEVNEVWKNANGSLMVRAEALRTMARLIGTRAPAMLSEAGQHSDIQVRRAAAQAWGTFLTDHEGGAVPEALVALLHDRSPRVREAAVEAVAVSGQSDALLLEMLNDKDIPVRATAAEVLGKRKLKSAVSGMLATLDRLRSGADTEVMTSLIEALGNIGDGRAAGSLRTYLSDRDVTVAKTAAKSLSLITGQPVVPNPPADLPSALPQELIDWSFQAMAQSKAGTPFNAILHTERGDITIKLFPQEAPFTVYNFMKLARANFFNSQRFHRVVPNFVVQTGDPRGDGWGGPGYAIHCEYNPLRYGRGAVGMALAGKDTGGSQFFITHSAQPHLDGRYTIFGQMVSGDAVLDSITEGDTILSVDVQAPAP